jgi:nucleoid DNA-binding protein
MVWTKVHIAKFFQSKSGLGKVESYNIVNLALWALRKVLANMQPGDKLEIRGIGVFEMRKLPLRLNAYNMNTKRHDRTALPRRKLVFRTSQTLKEEYRKV